MNKLTKYLSIKTVGLITLAAMAISSVAYAKDSVNGDAASFLQRVNSPKGKPLNELPPAGARQAFSDLQSSAKVDVSGVEVTQKIVQIDNRNIALTIVKPVKTKKLLPVFMYFHGGGWVLGNFQVYERLVRDLVIGSGAAAVFVNYDLSPEVKYPVAINQAYAATEWLSKHGKEIGVDGSRLAVVGDSTGATMATVVALMAKNQNTPNINFQVLLSPATDSKFDTGSYEQYANKYILTRDMMKWFWDQYAPNSKQRAEAHASPLQASTEQLSGMPPVLIQTAEFDVLRDEGEAYARKLTGAGVEVIVVRYNGTIHNFQLFNALSQTPATKAAIAQASTMLKQYLTK